MSPDQGGALLFGALRRQSIALAIATRPSTELRLALKVDLRSSTALTPPTVAGIIARHVRDRPVVSASNEPTTPQSVKEAA